MNDLTTLTSQLNAHVEGRMLVNAMYSETLVKLGKNITIPKNKTDTVKVGRRVVGKPLAVPLVEGVNPTGSKLDYEDITIVLDEWGDYYKISSKAIDTLHSPVLEDAAKTLGETLTRTRERVVFNALKGGTSVSYANGSSRSDVNTALSINDIRKAVRSLKAAKALPVREMLRPSTNVGTVPIEPAYIAVAHTDLEGDIRSLPGFTPAAEYGSPNRVSDLELGSVENVRFVLDSEYEAFENTGGAVGAAGSATDVESTGGSNANVYPIVIFGQEAFATVALRGRGAITPSIVQPTPSAADPLARNGYVGMVTYFAAEILNQNWVHRIEVAATNL